jgi:hypothetical protein
MTDNSKVDEIKSERPIETEDVNVELDPDQLDPSETNDVKDNSKTKDVKDKSKIYRSVSVVLPDHIEKVFTTLIHMSKRFSSMVVFRHPLMVTDKRKERRPTEAIDLLNIIDSKRVVIYWLADPSAPDAMALLKNCESPLVNTAWKMFATEGPSCADVFLSTVHVWFNMGDGESFPDPRS